MPPGAGFFFPCSVCSIFHKVGRDSAGHGSSSSRWWRRFSRILTALMLGSVFEYDVLSPRKADTAHPFLRRLAIRPLFLRGLSPIVAGLVSLGDVFLAFLRLPLLRFFFSAACWVRCSFFIYFPQVELSPFTRDLFPFRWTHVCSPLPPFPSLTPPALGGGARYGGFSSCYLFIVHAFLLTGLLLLVKTVVILLGFSFPV